MMNLRFVIGFRHMKAGRQFQEHLIQTGPKEVAMLEMKYMSNGKTGQILSGEIIQ